MSQEIIQEESEIDMLLEGTFLVPLSEGNTGKIEIFASDEKIGKLFIEFSDEIKINSDSIMDGILKIPPDVLKQLYILLTGGNHYRWYSKLFVDELALTAHVTAEDQLLAKPLEHARERLRKIFSDDGATNNRFWATAVWEYLRDNKEKIFPQS